VAGQILVPAGLCQGHFDQVLHGLFSRSNDRFVLALLAIQRRHEDADLVQ
jgi:hypothetical protein